MQANTQNQFKYKVTRKNNQTNELYTTLTTQFQLDNITKYPSTLYTLISIEPYNEDQPEEIQPKQPEQTEYTEPIQPQNNSYLSLVNEAINKVKNFPLTVSRKAYHKTKLYELKDLYYQLMSVNKYLFYPDTHEFRQYKLNIELGATKKELDGNLRYCLVTIHRELQQIRNDIYNNTYN